MKKKSVALGIALIAAAALTACSGGETAETQAPATGIRPLLKLARLYWI